MANFLCCDWGTSSFRLRIVDMDSLKVLSEISNSEGCAKTNEMWAARGEDEQGRLKFYLDILKKHVSDLSEKSKLDLGNIPLVISGMASSTIGMINLPYKQAPFSVDGSDLEAKKIPSGVLGHDIFIISGVKTADDVMRGEETKLVGCLDANDMEQILVLPGTHPKHVYARAGQVTGFETYMTGEFFDILSSESLLALSVKKHPGFNEDAFADGVKKGSTENLLHSSFFVRTNALFQKYSPEENFDYLSGLLIGFELKDLSNLSCPVVLLGTGKLATLYQKAFSVLSIPISYQVDADEALIKGQQKIVKSHLS